LDSELARIRTRYHDDLLSTIWGYRPNSGKPSNSDTGSRVSTAIGNRLLDRIGGSPTSDPIQAQGAGAEFARHTLTYLESAFSKIQHLRPGEWKYSTDQAPGIGAFEQYEHLLSLQRALKELPEEIRTSFSGDYLVTPDIVVGRVPVKDSEINAAANLISGEDDGLVGHSPLRSVNRETPRQILHASVSCKWTMRSDRAQNARTEALNLIRNRKGSTPHIMVVTGEPMPTRIASLAFGTGDIDCVYHMSLPELVGAVQDAEEESQNDILSTMIDGNRLRDISDMPFDMAV
jgi:hypothetical protein